MKLSAFFDEFYLPLKLIAARETTVTDYRLQVRKFHDYIGRVPTLDDLNDRAVALAMREAISAGRSPATANKLRRTILAMWRQAHELGKVDTLPRVRSARESKRVPDAWTAEQVAKIMGAAKQESRQVGDVPGPVFWTALLWFIYNTGVRITAVMETPCNAVDLSSRLAVVPAEVQKQRADQVFQLLPETVDALRELGIHRQGCLFDCWPYDRTVVQWPSLTLNYRRILSRAGLPVGATQMFHKLRRTTASYVAARLGRSAATKLLGHSCESVTARYLDPRLMGDVVPVADCLPRPSIDGRPSGRTAND